MVTTLNPRLFYFFIFLVSCCNEATKYNTVLNQLCASIDRMDTLHYMWQAKMVTVKWLLNYCRVMLMFCRKIRYNPLKCNYLLWTFDWSIGLMECKKLLLLKIFYLEIKFNPHFLYSEWSNCTACGKLLGAQWSGSPVGNSWCWNWLSRQGEVRNIICGVGGVGGKQLSETIV